MHCFSVGSKIAPIIKYKQLNVFPTSLAYLVKSVSCLTFYLYLVKSSNSTSQLIMGVFEVQYFVIIRWVCQLENIRSCSGLPVRCQYDKKKIQFFFSLQYLCSMFEILIFIIQPNTTSNIGRCSMCRISTVIHCP